MLNIIMHVLYVLLFTINVCAMELTFLVPVTITYNNNVLKEKRPILNNSEKSFFADKINSWKKIAEYWKDVLSNPIRHIFTSMPGIDVLLGDSDIFHYKNIIEQTYAFSPNKIIHATLTGSIVSEEVFRQKLLYLEVLLYNNTLSLPVENKDLMITRFNMPPAKTYCECPRIKDFLFRHKNCDFKQAKMLAAIFVLYLS